MQFKDLFTYLRKFIIELKFYFFFYFPFMMEIDLVLFINLLFWT